MSFLAPLFLVGAVGIGLPIFFHLIRRTTRDRKVFSSLMSAASPPKLTQRSRLEHLLLLMLRCAVLCLLAFGFARPFLKRAMLPPADAGGKRLLLLVDTSASMRRANLWADARDQVESIASRAGLADELALFTFDGQLRSRFSFQDWTTAAPGERSALLARKLAEVSPGWRSTQLGGALVQAAESLADSREKGQELRGRIEVITDLQEGSRLEQLQGYEWPKGLEVAIHVLKPRSANNASLQLVTGDEESDNRPAGITRVRVSNAAGSRREQFKVGWALPGQSSFAEKPLDVYVPPGQSRVVPVPAAASRSADRLVLQGDDDDFDNQVFVKTPDAIRLNVLYIGDETETNPKQMLYFLRRAFQETRRQTVGITARRAGDLIPASEAQASSLFVLTAPVSKEAAAALHSRAMAGKTVLIVPRGLDMQATLRQLVEADSITCKEVRPDNYALLGEIDFRHAIFSPFADPRFSDFTKIHFWKYTRLDADKIPRARVLARFDNHDPALVEVPVGAGRVLILASGWEPDTSQLALSSKFVPLMYSILETSGAPAPPPAQYRVGETIPLPLTAGEQARGLSVSLPDGSRKALADSQTNFAETDLPGVYTITLASGARSFVVNLDPAESRTAPLPADELERLGVPMLPPADTQPGAAERKTRLQNAEQENRQKLWRWVIFGTMGIVVLETWLAGRTARRVAAPALAVPG